MDAVKEKYQKQVARQIISRTGEKTDGREFCPHY